MLLRTFLRAPPRRIGCFIAPSQVNHLLFINSYDLRNFSAQQKKPESTEFKKQFAPFDTQFKDEKLEHVDASDEY